MLEEDKLFNEISDDIKRAKLKGRRSVFKINMEVSDNTAKNIKKSFENFGYAVDIRKCISCKQSWSFAIYF